MTEKAKLLDGSPKVQLSLDLQTLADAMPTAEIAVKAGVDWLEVGTPLILGEGLHAVAALHTKYPNHPIIADLKTMDAGYLEAEMMYKAGASFVVVMRSEVGERRKGPGLGLAMYVQHGTEIRRAAPGALVLAFSCSHSVDAKLLRQVAFAASLDAARPAQVVRELGTAVDHPVSLDHPEGVYLKGLLLRV